MHNLKNTNGSTLTTAAIAIAIISMGITASIGQINTVKPTTSTTITTPTVAPQPANNPPTTTTTPTITTAPSTITPSIDDDAMQGEKGAKVTIIEFSDYECPYCAKFTTETLPQIKKDYIDTGKVRFVYRDFPLAYHTYAKTAAMAAECAGDEGDAMYYKYHDKLYENYTILSTDNFKKWAKDLGLDTAKFDTCLDNQKYATEVEKDYQAGEAYGISGTPSFFINNQPLMGAYPFTEFQKIIEEELKK